MNKMTHSHAQYLTTKEIQRMSSDDIIKHVYALHKSTNTPVEDVWERMFENFGRQTINDMLGDSESSLNNDQNFEVDSRSVLVGTVYLIAFGLTWGVFHTFVKNQFNALSYAIVACGFISIFVTLLFINAAGKNERNYLNAINKLRKAQSIYINRGGFKNLSGKPLDYVKEDV